MNARAPRYTLAPLLIKKPKIMSALTFETVNKEIESLDLGALRADLNLGASTKRAVGTANIAPKLCLVWNKIGGIVKLIANLPLIPKKWRAALNLLVDTLDSLCN
ncbi:MAG: hypothetical protein ACPG7E_04430 [Marinirhabdus sp.]